MRFWTVSYIAIDDWRLGFAYYGGVALILLYFAWGVLFDQGYLEYDQVQGICRPSLALPGLHPPRGHAGHHRAAASAGRQREGNASASNRRLHCGAGEPCSPVPLEEVELEPGAGQILIATHIRERLETCSDTFCRYPQAEIKSADFYVADVEDYNLSMSCNAQSFRFFSEDCHHYENTRSRPESQLRGASERRPPCRFAAANQLLFGRLLGPGGKVLQTMPAGTADAFPVSTWLAAAGVTLDRASDAPEAADDASLRRAGMVILVTVAYRNHPETNGFLDWFRLGERSSVMTYDVEVRRIAAAGYHVSKATVIEDSAGLTSMRELHEVHGTLLQFEVSGRVGRFSWQALADELVLKLGWLTLLQLLLDMSWQYLLPLVGVNYNREVYRWKVNSRRELVAPKLI